MNKEITEISSDDNYELQIYDSALDMHNKIKEKNELSNLSRVVSTFDYLHKKDGNLYYVEEGDFKLPWNNSYPNTWAEEKKTIDEVGSIYTIQGFDLNYVGVILGPSVKYDERKDILVIDSNEYKDIEAFRNINDIKDFQGKKVNPDLIKEKIILNSINVLMKRGIKGLYIYASNEGLRKRLSELYKNKIDKENSD